MHGNNVSFVVETIQFFWLQFSSVFSANHINTCITEFKELSLESPQNGLCINSTYTNYRLNVDTQSGKIYVYLLTRHSLEEILHYGMQSGSRSMEANVGHICDDWE